MMEDKSLDGYVMWLEPRQSFAGGSKPSIYCVGRNMCLIFLFLSISNTVSHAFVTESKAEVSRTITDGECDRFCIHNYITWCFIGPAESIQICSTFYLIHRPN